MSRTLLAHGAVALARALAHQRPHHRAAVRGLADWDKNTARVRDPVKDCAAGGSGKSPDDLQGDKGHTNRGGEKQGGCPSQNKQLQPEKTTAHICQHVPQYGLVYTLSTSRNNSTFIGGRKDSSGGSKESSDKTLAEKKSDAEKLKSKVPEKPPMPPMPMPNVSKQQPLSDHVRKSTFAGSKTSLVEIRTATKLKDLQNVRAPEKAQELTKSPSYPIQPPHFNHHHQPHRGPVINWRTRTDKCGLFCEWNDSLTGGLTKPAKEISAAKSVHNENLKCRSLESIPQVSRSASVPTELPHANQVTPSTSAGSKSLRDEIRIVTKLNDLQGGRAAEKTQEPTKPPSYPTQPPHSQHERHHLPHRGVVINWRTCNNKCGLFCRWNDFITGKLTKLSDEIHAAKKSEESARGRAPGNSLEKDKPQSEVKQQTQNEQKLQHLPHHGSNSSLPTCSDKCGLFCQWKGSLSGASDKTPDKSLVINTGDDLKGRKSPEKAQESAKSPTQTKKSPHADHVMSHSISRSLEKPSKSDSALQQRRKLDEWDMPPNEWRIALYAKESVVKKNKEASEMIQQTTTSSSEDKQLPTTEHVMSRCVARNVTRRSASVSALRQTHSWDRPPNERPVPLYANKGGSAPGSKPPDKPGAKAPDKPGDKAPEGPLKRKFSKHVEMLLGRGEFSKKEKEPARKDEKPKQKEGSVPGKGGKK